MVDWHGILPFWQRSWQYDDVKDELLLDAYSPLWFKVKNGEPRFLVGAIDFFTDTSLVMFSNGTHRTRVLAKRLRYLPLSAHASAYQSKALRPFFLRRIDKDEPFEMPDFPLTAAPQSV